MTSEIRSLVANCTKALIISHVMPDGDTIGSGLGLSWALRGLGIETRLSCAEPVPPSLRFLPGSNEYSPCTRTDEEAVFIVDCSDLQRIGDYHDIEAVRRGPIVNIDHHITNTRFGTINCIEETAATTQLVLDVITELGIALDATIATCLLTGLVTDTRGFRTYGTDAHAMAAATRLMNAGAVLAQITDAVFNHRSMATLRLWGPAFTRAQLHDDVLWTEITRELLAESNTQVTDTTGLVNFLSTLHKPRVAIVFREMDATTIDVSMRSTIDVDVSVVAYALGGGGHRQAAGCQIEGSLAKVRERVLGMLRETMAQETLED